MLPVEADTNAACADAVEIWRFETLAALNAGMQNEADANASYDRESWATAQEPLTTAEPVIR